MANVAPEPQIAGAVDLAHAPTTDAMVDAVRTEPPAVLERGGTRDIGVTLDLVAERGEQRAAQSAARLEEPVGALGLAKDSLERVGERRVTLSRLANEGRALGGRQGERLIEERVRVRPVAEIHHGGPGIRTS